PDSDKETSHQRRSPELPKSHQSLLQRFPKRSIRLEAMIPHWKPQRAGFPRECWRQRVLPVHSLVTLLRLRLTVRAPLLPRADAQALPGVTRMLVASPRRSRAEKGTSKSLWQAAVAFSADSHLTGNRLSLK